MPEKFSVQGKPMNDFAFWILMESVSKLVLDKQIPITPGEPLEVEFKVNGVEVSFQLAMNQIEKNLDRAIAEKAGELFEEKMVKVTSGMEETMEDLRRQLCLKAREQGFLVPMPGDRE